MKNKKPIRKKLFNRSIRERLEARVHAKVTDTVAYAVTGSVTEPSTLCCANHYSGRGREQLDVLRRLTEEIIDIHWHNNLS